MDSCFLWYASSFAKKRWQKVQNQPPHQWIASQKRRLDSHSTGPFETETYFSFDLVVLIGGKDSKFHTTLGAKRFCLVVAQHHAGRKRNHTVVREVFFTHLFLLAQVWIYSAKRRSWYAELTGQCWYIFFVWTVVLKLTQNTASFLHNFQKLFFVCGGVVKKNQAFVQNKNKCGNINTIFRKK